MTLAVMQQKSTSCAVHGKNRGEKSEIHICWNFLKRKEGNLRGENGNIIIRGYDSREDGDLWMNIREEMEAKGVGISQPLMLPAA